MKIEYCGYDWEVDDELINQFGGVFQYPLQLRGEKPVLFPPEDCFSTFEVPIPTYFELEKAIQQIHEHERSL